MFSTYENQFNYQDSKSYQKMGTLDSENENFRSYKVPKDKQQETLELQKQYQFQSLTISSKDLKISLTDLKEKTKQRLMEVYTLHPEKLSPNQLLGLHCLLYDLNGDLTWELKNMKKQLKLSLKKTSKKYYNGARSEVSLINMCERTYEKSVSKMLRDEITKVEI